MSLRHCGAALLFCLAVVVAGCGGGDGTSSAVTGESISFQQLAQSASRSAEATSGRFSFDLALTLPGTGEPLTVTGDGAFDAAARRASFAVDMSSFAKLIGAFVTGLAGANAKGVPDFGDPKGWQIEVIQDGDVGYVRLPALDDRLPAGKTWLRAREGTSAGGFDFGELHDLGTNDPRDVLDALQSVTSEVETVGSEQLRGVETTHYHAVVDPVKLGQAKDREGRSAPDSLVDQLASGSGVADIPVDVWLDAEGLVRKLTLAVTASESGTGRAGGAEMSFELWDYGEAVDIEVPPASEVADASALGG